MQSKGYTSNFFLNNRPYRDRLPRLLYLPLNFTLVLLLKFVLQMCNILQHREQCTTGIIKFTKTILLLPFVLQMFVTLKHREQFKTGIKKFTINIVPHWPLQPLMDRGILLVMAPNYRSVSGKTKLLVFYRAVEFQAIQLRDKWFWLQSAIIVDEHSVWSVTATTHWGYYYYRVDIVARCTTYYQTSIAQRQDNWPKITKPD